MFGLLLILFVSNGTLNALNPISRIQRTISKTRPEKLESAVVMNISCCPIGSFASDVVQPIGVLSSHHQHDLLPTWPSDQPDDGPLFDQHDEQLNAAITVRPLFMECYARHLVSTITSCSVESALFATNTGFYVHTWAVSSVSVAPGAK
jgi:hypothetical protein